jgi:hypothetical protein
MERNNKKCECCGFFTLPEDSIFEICPLCGWQDDGVQNDDPDYAGGANELSLNEYRSQWLKEHKRTNRSRNVA